MNNVTNFTSGKIYFPLIKFAIPLMLAMFLQVMYSAVDLMIVGQFATSADVSGVATGGQIMHTIQGFLIGFSISVTVLIGQRIGEKKIEIAGNAVGASTCVFAVIALFFTCILMFFAENISNILNAPPEAYQQTIDYIRISSLGVTFFVGYNLLGAVFRGLGDAKTPLMTVGIACVTNIILDLVLVAQFGMGAKGAAIATVFAQAISVILSIIIIKKRGLPFTFSYKHIKFHNDETKKILLYGVPIALQDTLVNFTFLFVTGLVNGLGLYASAGLGVAGRLIGFIMLLPASFAQSISTFTAQNYGAKSIDRAKLALKYAVTTSFIISIFICFSAYNYGDVLLSPFSKDSLVLSQGWLYMKAFSFDCMLCSFLFSLTGFFTGCGKTTFVMLQGIICAIGIRVPVAYFMSLQEGATLFHIGLATPAASVVQVVLCLIYYQFLSKQLKIRETALEASYA